MNFIKHKLKIDDALDALAAMESAVYGVELQPDFLQKLLLTLLQDGTDWSSVMFISSLHRY